MALSGSISTTASAPWSRVTPIPPSSKPCRNGSRSAPTSLRRSKTTSSSATSWPNASIPRLAIRQLRFGSDDGRDPHRPRLHRQGHDHQNLRLLPRASRLRDGLDRRAIRQDRRPRELHVPPIRRRHSQIRGRNDHRRAIQRCRQPSSAASSD